jgi:hypothetical protein
MRPSRRRLSLRLAIGECDALKVSKTVMGRFGPSRQVAYRRSWQVASTPASRAKRSR